MQDGEWVNITGVYGSTLVMIVPAARTTTEGYITMARAASDRSARVPAGLISRLRLFVAATQELVNSDNGTFRCPGDCAPEQQLYYVDL